MSTHQDIDREQRLFELVRDPLFVTSPEGRSLRVKASISRQAWLRCSAFLLS